MSSTFTGRLLTRLLNAVFRSRKESPAVPVPNPSAVSPAARKYFQVSKADAISYLCQPTGDEQLDNLHVILIDLLQKDFIAAVHAENDRLIRFHATKQGAEYIDERLKQAVDQLLERMFGDS